MSRTTSLDQNLDDWLELPAWRHVVFVAVVLVAATVRWHESLLASGPQIDEATYLAAFRSLADGRSAYEVASYHYTPLFARLGGHALDLLGTTGTLAALRFISVLGLGVTVWCSLAWLRTPWGMRLGLALAFVTLAPAPGAGLATGNVSFAVIGVILFALTQWPRRSVLTGALPSGLALGATIAAKPLAPLALVALFFHRTAARENLGRQQYAGRLAGVAGGLVAALLLLPMISQLAAMSAQPIHPLSYARSFSLRRLLSLAGIEVSTLGVFLVGAIALAILLRFLKLDRSQLLAVAVTASVLVTPIIWNHTLLLTLPVQVMALAIATSRWRGAPSRTSRRRAYEFAFVVLGALAIQFSEGFGAVDEFSRATQFFLLALPYFAPAALTAYVLGSTAASSPRSERRKR